MKCGTCSDCKNMLTRKVIGICRFMGICTGDIPACGSFEQQPITNGDVLRQGGNYALINFADGIRRRMCHYCVFSKDKSCVDKTGDCWEGVRVWLYAPADCVKQNGNHDTQVDLCKADNTESEGKDE